MYSGQEASNHIDIRSMREQKHDVSDKMKIVIDERGNSKQASHHMHDVHSLPLVHRIRAGAITVDILHNHCCIVVDLERTIVHFVEDHLDHIHRHFASHHIPSVADCHTEQENGLEVRHSLAEVGIAIEDCSMVQQIEVLAVGRHHTEDSTPEECQGNHQEFELVDCRLLGIRRNQLG
jgi:hypothetical protein